jgi:hypothetical protein
MSRGRADRLRLALALAALFGVSSLTDLRALGAAAAAALVATRGAGLGRALRTAAPLAAVAAVAAAALRWATEGRAPAPAPSVALVARATTMAWITFAAVARVRWFDALAPWPTATRLLALVLAQIHALRRLAGEGRAALESRLPRRPNALDVARNLGGLTTAALALAARHARESVEAVRSRGGAE